jgi:signal transduction histidine kinase
MSGRRSPRWLARARGSVRLRVTLLAAGLFAVTLAVAAFALLRALEQDLVADVRSADLATLRTRAAQVVNEGVPADAEPLRASSGVAYRLPGPAAQQILMVMGEPPTAVVHSTNGPEPRSASAGTPSAGTPSAGVPGAGTGVDVVEVGDLPITQPGLLGIEGDVRDYTVSWLSTGGVTLATASPLDSVRDTIATTKRLLWLAGPALVALVAGLAWLLAGRALRPVHAVTSRVAAIGSGSLHERVPVPASGDEIAELAATMNAMLARLEDASATNRRLVADASHELRTPVAVMRAELEVARGTAADWDATSGVLLGELDRLQSLIDDLLLLARGDERGFDQVPFSLADVARDTAARTRGVPVAVTVEGDVDPVVGDRAAITRALDHLVTNAARHAASVVHVAVTATGDEATVVVDDDGPGIPPARRADVVRRFVRLDEARARDGGGAGLGLAVTADVAAAHGGRLEIGDAPIGGARLTLVLPRTPTAPDPGSARAARA